MSVDRVGGMGGVERMSIEMGRRLSARGHRVDLVYREAVWPVAEFAASMTHSNDLDGRLEHPLRAVRGMAPAVLAGVRHAPDVVYVNRFEDLSFALPLHMLTGVPIVCHWHYFSGHTRIELKSRGVKAFISVSQATADEWVAKGNVDPRRIEVIPNGINTRDFPVTDGPARTTARERLGIRPDAFIVNYCGRVSTEKGVDVLVDAWERLALPPETHRLMIVGVSQEWDEATTAYQNALIARNVPGIDWLPTRADVLTPLQAADLAVLPSRHESFGLAIVEALSTGLPVIATRTDGLPETVRDQGVLVEPDSPEELAAAIKRQLTMDANAEAARHRHLFVNQAYSIERMTDAVEDVLYRSARRGRKR
ncbi:glycosyltransferase family 4 protein [Xylanimonas protaetiae]|uniref:Glycosyltransferase family 1 protein n=1 Tax=Xylanimonas protaetiae TaxID=2509457 RepID=A0A4P6F711_9MICO|nr:glycosyltransferase family 4 protein [Xylanimonas protaetiae]QAY69017.1 glycosyltransferase family 1 protein [Xylanimonas protaetiae]